MRKNQKITIIIGIFTLIILLFLGFYYDIYYPKANEQEKQGLTILLKTYGYNTELAEDLVDGRKSGYWSMNITMLKTNPDSLSFVYYTTDSAKISYTVSFWTTPKFFKYNVNTQMNILTNIYKTCKYHFPQEYKLDSIYYKDFNSGYYSQDSQKFIDSLIICIKQHINDKNNIKDIQEVDTCLHKKDQRLPTDFLTIGELGTIILDTNKFICEKVPFGSQDINKDKIIIDFHLPDSIKFYRMDFDCSRNPIKNFIGAHTGFPIY